MVSSAPTILRPRVRFPSTPSMVFQFAELMLKWEKDENKLKRGRDWPILKNKGVLCRVKGVVIYSRCLCIRTSIISRIIFAIIQLSGLLSSCRSQLSSYQTGPDLLAINSDRDASIDDAAAINMLAMAVPGTPGTYTIKLVLPFNNCHKIMARFGLRLLPQN